MELISIGDAIHKAEEVYYLANNQYTNNQEDLDLEVPIPQHISMYIGISESDTFISIYNTKLPYMAYIFYLDNHPLSGFRGIRHCRVEGTNNERLKKLCQNITGNSIEGSDNYWVSVF